MTGGFGKTRVNGAGEDFRLGPELAKAHLLWSPMLSWNLRAVMDLEAQPHAHSGVDIGEAYLIFKPLPVADTRFSARAGLFYPPVSTEHDGYSGKPWLPMDVITPSAINSWIGEEVKVLGAEAHASHTVGGADFGATLGVFGGNDTSGTLLALRGWTLDDYDATANTRFSLPPLNSFLKRVQAPFTEPVRELDGRLGYYARADAHLANRLAINFFYYDNNGDKTAVDQLQWSWATQFSDVGLAYQLDDKTVLKAQALTGRTQMGFPRGVSVWVDTNFSSAFISATREIGKDSTTLRAESFHEDNHPFDDDENYGENGWALTADYKHPLSRHATVFAEVVHVESTREAREYAGIEANQSQTTLQTSVRFSF